MTVSNRFVAFLLLVFAWQTQSFIVIDPFTSTGAAATSTTTTTTTTTQLSCICINCARVTNCKAYHFVETKHEQPHINENPTFTPAEGSPTIHVNVRTLRDEQVMARVWKEHKDETARAEQKAAQVQKNDNNNNNESTPSQQPLHGETVYDLSPQKTTVEYDVVACQDFVEDMGCWVRNMPEEIKKANPDFVPT